MLINIELDIIAVESGIVCHQVNCQRAIGAGLSGKIIKKWPIVEKNFRANYGILGDVLFVPISAEIVVANLYGQDRYGREKQHTDYRAVEACLIKVAEYSTTNKMEIYIPYHMGCGLGGANWNRILELIEKHTPYAYITKSLYGCPTV